MIRERLEPALRALWFARSPGAAAAVAGTLLAPLSQLTARVAARQRARILALPRPPVPVVVVGNLVVGGAGKTPLVTAIVAALAERGWTPGIIASGYGANREDARLVGPDDPPETAGDEALLLTQLSERPVAAGRQRAEALAALLAAHPEIDVVVSDDGLQHAALPRTLEIAVFDRRGAGNGRLLPSGPLREPLAHLSTMDAIALNGDEASVPASRSPTPPAFRFHVVPYRFVLVDGLGEPLSPAAFRALVEGPPSAQAGAR
ncbi:MAG TPA: tetraacyldisaccharide 4'-kinase, partial [Burkholderiaceae bacterium]|nr:tetraacyldisaccharide 4'-kinase [Burkholderiaceae bacterium]